MCQILNGDVLKEALPLKMVPISSPETFVSNYITPRNNPKDGRIHVMILIAETN
jgi:hypothetical protein